jgi:putative endonuclease
MNLPNPGLLGEELLSQWVLHKGGVVLEKRWHCSLGELDLVALNAQGELIFIEVKTRSAANIDQDGVLSVTRSKQAKIIRSAKIYLLRHPQHRSRNCRFDIALVRYQPIAADRNVTGAITRSSTRSPHKKSPSGFTRTIETYELTLVNYFVNAFDSGNF